MARTTATLALLPVLLVVVAAPAAAQSGVAEERLSFGIAGPVGIVAVVLGAGVFLVGLLRRRRNRSGLTPRPTPEPARAKAPV